MHAISQCGGRSISSCLLWFQWQARLMLKCTLAWMWASPASSEDRSCTHTHHSSARLMSRRVRDHSSGSLPVGSVPRWGHCSLSVFPRTAPECLWVACTEPSAAFLFCYPRKWLVFMACCCRAPVTPWDAVGNSIAGHAEGSGWWLRGHLHSSHVSSSSSLLLT